jgi:hydrogenase maturation protease
LFRGKLVTEPRIVILGYGNTLRGDDALGRVVADRLAAENLDDRVCILSEPVLTPELADHLSGATLVIFVDAACEGPAGEIVCRNASEVSAGGPPVLHSFGPRPLLELTRQLSGNSPSAYLVSARGRSFEVADCRLSPDLEALVVPMMTRIRELAGRHFDEWPRDRFPGSA